MRDYTLPNAGDPREIGRRARRIRELLGLTADEVARRAEVHSRDVSALEDGADLGFAAAIAIHRVLSVDAIEEEMFKVPRFRNLDEAEAFENRRLAGQ